MSTVLMAMEIRDMVMIMAYPVVLFAAILMFKRGFSSHKQQLNAIIFIAIVVACIQIYPRTVLKAVDIVTFASSEVSEKIDKGMNEWSKAKITGQGSTWNVTAKITSAMYKASFAFSSIIRAFLNFFQRVAIYILIALSPLMLSFLLIKETSDISVKFIMTTMAIILWSVGYNLTDMMLFSGWDVIMHKWFTAGSTVAALGAYGVTASAIGGVGLSTALPVVTISLAFALCFYFLIGILVFNIIGIVLIMTLFHGGNPVSSAMSAVTASSSFVNAGVNAGKMGGSIKAISPDAIAKGAAPGIGQLAAGGISKAAKGLGNLGK